jgi:bifunctional non-homologous end joining protein LigD
MTPRVTFLSELPVRAVLDGELVALDSDGKPDFPLLCEAMLAQRPGIALTYLVFEVLRVDGRDVSREPYAHRRQTLEQMSLGGSHWRTPEAFTDGEALWDAVCEHELEGVVAKRRSSQYVPGEREWVKTKNRAYRRWEMEQEGALRRTRVKQFN